MLATSTMYFPGTQDAGTGAELPDGQSEPAGQSSQDGWPTSSWYLPSSQLSHSALPAAADVPVLQLRGATEPTTHDVPSGQATQSDFAPAPGELR